MEYMTRLMKAQPDEKTPAKPTGHRYTSVADLNKGEGLAPEVQAKYEEIEKATSLVHQLSLLRQQAGLTQEEMANRLGCTQSAVSKVESGRDEDLTIKEILGYAKATQQSLIILAECHQKMPKDSADFQVRIQRIEAPASSAPSLHSKRSTVSVDD